MICTDPKYIRKLGICVPCGKCPCCRDRYLSDWTARMMAELSSSLTGYVVTLTFDDLHYNAFTPEKWGKRQFQLFLKRLRHSVSQLDPKYTYRRDNVLNGLKSTKNIKYFAVGERGKKNNRFHFHCMIFNVPLNIENAQDLIEKQWGQGLVYIDNIDAGAVQYSLAYMLKDDRSNEVRLFSKGLGIEYLSSMERINYHRTALDGIVRVQGFKGTMHRYYKDRIFNKQEKESLFLKSRQMDSLELAERANYIKLKNESKKSRK